MKKILLFITLIIMLSACADKKSFKRSDGTTIVAEPYGWANYEARKVDGVVYEISMGNVILGILLCETVIAPVYLSGWELYEPVRYDEFK